MSNHIQHEVSETTPDIRSNLKRIEALQEIADKCHKSLSEAREQIAEIRASIAEQLHGIRPDMWVWGTKPGSPRKLYYVREVQPRSNDKIQERPWVIASPITLYRQPAQNKIRLFAFWELATEQEVYNGTC